jgi:hypothetical protein
MCATVEWLQVPRGGDLRSQCPSRAGWGHEAAGISLYPIQSSTDTRHPSPALGKACSIPETSTGLCLSSQLNPIIVGVEPAPLALLLCLHRLTLFYMSHRPVSKKTPSRRRFREPHPNLPWTTGLRTCSIHACMHMCPQLRTRPCCPGQLHSVIWWVPSWASN